MRLYLRDCQPPRQLPEDRRGSLQESASAAQRRIVIHTWATSLPLSALEDARSRPARGQRADWKARPVRVGRPFSWKRPLLGLGPEAEMPNQA